MPSAVFWAGQDGGTAEYRCHVPGRALQRAGWDVDFIDHLDVTPDGRVRDDPDVLVISRIMDFHLPAAVDAITSAGRTTVVYDTDDWFVSVPDYNPASKLPQEDIDAMHATMAAADVITCSTPGLAEGYANLGDTVVLPNLLDPELWGDAHRYRTTHDKLRIGWLSAWNWRGGDAKILEPWLADWLHAHDDVQFVALGCPEIAEAFGIDVLTVDGEGTTDASKHLRPYQHLPAMCATLDVGLVPLTYNWFNWYGKSWAKGMEYGAAWVPAVASPSHAYRNYIRPGVNGQLVRKADWITPLEKTIANLDQMRNGARAVAEQHWIDDHIGLWVDVYREADHA